MEPLKRAYLRLPSGLRARIPAALEYWAYDRLLARLTGTSRPRQLEVKLWGGLSRLARTELVTVARDPAVPPRTAGEAALVLAGWHTVQGDLAGALDLAVLARERCPALVRDRRHVMLEALLLCRLDRGAEARALLEARGRKGFDVSMALMRANTWGPEGAVRDEAVLGEINAVFRRFDLMPVAKRDAAAPLALDNLRGIGPAGGRVGPRVSVIVPIYNGAATIAMALSSLAAQTWENLEILVVDDASNDAGPDLVADLARTDRRFRLIRQERNRGSYAARNLALPLMTGDYVTVHDADDWSHPEKIARHVADLERRGKAFNISAWVRATPDLHFWGPWRPTPNLVTPNFSSVFFRRDLVERIGPWDSARVGADREFVHRAERLCALAPQEPFLRTCPLAFGRSDEGSLTRLGAMHAATIFHGVRREYRECAELWHAELAAERTKAPGWTAAPPFFPAPVAIRSERRFPDHDVLFIGDFNLSGGTFHSAWHMMRAAQSAGLDCAIFQYRRYDLSLSRPLKPEFRRHAWERGIRIVAAGEAVHARTVVVTYPPLFAEVLDRFPPVEHDHLAVLVNQMAERDRARRDIAYDPPRVRAHLSELLGSEGIWVPISERVRLLMAADPRYPPPHPDTWTPLIDIGERCAREPRWRGAERAVPVIGRHGRDHPLKWPRDPGQLAAAYCANMPCETHFLGGARHAKARLGNWPRNWKEEPFGAREVRDFLSELDIFLHYPDPDYIEEFGRAPMEAMAVGVPVILPPEFAPTFGEAALYAAPNEVWPLVEHLWRDRTFWEARVMAGRGFVSANCSYGVFPDRLARLAGSDAPPSLVSASVPGVEA